MIKPGDIVTDPEGLYWRVELVEDGVLRVVGRVEPSFQKDIAKTPPMKADREWGFAMISASDEYPNSVIPWITTAGGVKKALLPIEAATLA